MKRLVLNELESLKAGYTSNKFEKDLLVSQHLQDYWDGVTTEIASNIDI